MATYYISGFLKKSDEYTHYYFHYKDIWGEVKCEWYSKQDAIKLVEENFVYVITWDYKNSRWIKGKRVQVFSEWRNKFLRSDPDDKKTNNLAHLIDYSDLP